MQPRRDAYRACHRKQNQTRHRASVGAPRVASCANKIMLSRVISTDLQENRAFIFPWKKEERKEKEWKKEEKKNGRKGG